MPSLPLRINNPKKAHRENVLVSCNPPERNFLVLCNPLWDTHLITNNLSKGHPPYYEQSQSEQTSHLYIDFKGSSMISLDPNQADPLHKPSENPIYAYHLPLNDLSPQIPKKKHLSHTNRDQHSNTPSPPDKSKKPKIKELNCSRN